jgi:hypothetical protein
MSVGQGINPQTMMPTRGFTASFDTNASTAFPKTPEPNAVVIKPPAPAVQPSMGEILKVMTEPTSLNLMPTNSSFVGSPLYNLIKRKGWKLGGEQPSLNPR